MTDEITSFYDALLEKEKDEELYSKINFEKETKLKEFEILHEEMKYQLLLQNEMSEENVLTQKKKAKKN